MKLMRISPLLIGLKGVPAHDEDDFALKVSISIKELRKRHSHQLRSNPANRKLEDVGVCGSECGDYNLCECLNGNIDRCIVSSIRDYCEGGSLSSCVPQWLQSSCSTLCADSTVSDTSVYCSACDLLECCDGTNSFPTCVESFPGVTDLLNLIDTIEGIPFDGNNLTLSDNLFSGVDENNYEDDFISSGVEDATTLFPIIMDLIENPNSMPLQFCPDGTCSVDGFCECLSGDLGKCSEDLVSEICTAGALFQCGPEGFQDTCSTVCNGDGNGDVRNATFCALCDIATCCNDGTSTIEDCAKAIVPIDDDFSLGGIDSFFDDDFTSGVFSGAGFDNATDLFPMITDLIENPASVLPEFCPDGTCPVTGFCECLNGDMGQCSLELLHEVCSQSAFFTCGPEGFEDMCTTECSGEVDGDVLNAAFCALCDIAICCNDGTSPIEDCAKAAIPFDLVSDFIPQGDIGDIASVIPGLDFGNIGDYGGLIASFLPGLCPDGSCPVEGFCECYGGDFSQCTETVLIEACEANALIECNAEDFDERCSTICSGEETVDLFNTALCLACDVATCCRDGGLPEDCTAEVSSLLVGLDSSTTGVVSNGTETGNITATDANDVNSESPSDISTSNNSTEDVAAASTEATARSDSTSMVLSTHSLIFAGITSLCLFM
eukprot:CAMPEP_0171416172 /NCGR_PEP_ID=MMETSP0880-20121228/39959_1 /TAXON_ID=67004 /ORGANISM="Thalassiosira weissflogii, Strain CCMP1336" /LENGTH=662 /DNA_ID=CAMNT_0011934411 /DNA_START=211 /DNA_END=2199 /DNA_ORIENTATION=+